MDKASKTAPCANMRRRVPAKRPIALYYITPQRKIDHETRNYHHVSPDRTCRVRDLYRDQRNDVTTTASPSLHDGG